jgi:hypothetical protein
MAEQTGFDLGEFTASYGDAPVKLGALSMSLPEALAAHEQAVAFGACPPDSLSDPAAQVHFIAKALHAGGSLRPEHKHLLPPEPR